MLVTAVAATVAGDGGLHEWSRHGDPCPDANVFVPFVHIRRTATESHLAARAIPADGDRLAAALAGTPCLLLTMSDAAPIRGIPLGLAVRAADHAQTQRRGAKRPDPLATLHSNLLLARMENMYVKSQTNPTLG